MATHSSILAWRILMHREAWRATAHWVIKSQSRLSDLAQHSITGHVVNAEMGLNEGRYTRFLTHTVSIQ